MPLSALHLLVTAAIVLLALVILVVLLARERGARRRLEQQLAEREPIHSFEAGEIYILLGAAAVDLDGEVHHFGLVELEDGSRRLFLTTEQTSVLATGDTFSSVRGRLVRLDGPGQAPAEMPTVSAAEHEPEDDDADRTQIFRAPPTAPVADDGFGQPFLEVTDGPDSGRRFLLPVGSVRIGRDAGNEVSLSDASASRVHCQVGFDDGRFHLRDNNSTNGTLLNGEKAVEATLEFGDRIQVAETEMRFSCDGFDLKDSDRARAIAAFERCLQRTPDLLPALRMLAFLLERDVARRAEAQPLWQRIARLEENG